MIRELSTDVFGFAELYSDDFCFCTYGLAGGSHHRLPHVACATT